MGRVNQFLDYMWTHPNVKIRYRASDMILNVHSDASHLSAPNARSRAGGYFFLGSIPQDAELIIINGAIHITCTILKLVAASAAKSQTLKMSNIFYIKETVQVVPENTHKTHRVNPSSVTLVSSVGTMVMFLLLN